jgi:hypothetical protein
MTVSRVTYATREQLKTAAGWNGAGSDADADRLLESHSGKIDELFYRHFYPLVATRLYDWPSRSQVSRCALWLDRDLLEVTTFTATGTAIVPADYYLGRDEDTENQPFNRIELDETSTATFGAGGQRALSVAGLWGYSQDETPAGAVGAGGITDSATTLLVTNAGAIGVGNLIRIGDERLIVSDRAFADTTKTISGNVAASATDSSIPVASGHGLLAGEVIQIDDERMYIEVAATTSLTVERAFDGTSLAAHTTGTAILAPRSLTVVRGAYGTTAASHLAAVAIVRHVPPSLITDLVIAEAVAQRVQEGSGYAVTTGAGGMNTGPGGGAMGDRIALLDLRARAKEAYKRVKRVAL